MSESEGPKSGQPEYGSPTAPQPYAVPPLPEAGAPAHAAPRRSALPIVLLIILVLLIATCVITSIGMFKNPAAGAFGSGQGGRWIESLVAGDGDAEGVAMLVPIEGAIGVGGGGGLLGGGVDPFQQILDRLEAAREREVDAVLLAVNSPGGGVWASARLHEEIKKTQAAGIKVVAQLKTIAASGGYYVAAPCDHIVAAPSTLTASIGVILTHYDVSGLVSGKLDVEYNPFTSAPQKDILSPFRPSTQAEEAHINSMVKEMFDEFVGVVVDGRAGKISEETVRGLESTIVTGGMAFKNGLVDELGFEAEALAAAAKLCGKDSLRLVRLDREQNLFSLLGAQAAPTVELDASALLLQRFSALPPGTPCYIWAGGL